MKESRLIFDPNVDIGVVFHPKARGPHKWEDDACSRAALLKGIAA